MSRRSSSDQSPKRRSRVAAALGLTLALVLGGLATTTLTDADETWPKPINLKDNSNYSCAELASWLVHKGYLNKAPDWQEFKIDKPGPLATGLYQDPNSDFEVEITNSTATGSDWESNFGVDLVYFKSGGGSSMLYLYNPPGPPGTEGVGQGTKGNGLSHLTFCFAEPELGNLKVEKIVHGHGNPPQGTSFAVEVNCQGWSEPAQVVFDAQGNVSSGTNNFEGIPAGTECTVVETDNGGADAVSYHPGNGKVTIQKDKTAKVQVKNRFDPVGDIIVEKSVDGNVPGGAEFDIEIDCGDAGKTTAKFNSVGDLISPAGTDRLVGLPTGTGCTVTETNDGGADNVSYSPGQQVNIPKNSSVTVSVTNTFDRTGDLKVEKKVEGKAPQGTSFTVAVDCDGWSEPAEVTFDRFGNVTSGSGSNHFSDLPTGTECTITETNDGGADNVSYNPGQNVTIGENDLVKVKVTNTFVPKGNIKVSKTVEGNAGDGAEFVVDIDCGDAGSVTATFDRNGDLIGGSDELTGLPAGTECSVTETDDGGADSVTINPDGPVTIQKNKTAEVEVTNTFDPTGDVRVVKKVWGKGSPASDAEFVVDLDCGDAGSTTATFDASGELIDGSNELTDLPVGTECSVTETDNGGADSVVYHPSDTVTVAADETITVQVKNKFLPRGDIEVIKALAGEGSPDPGAEFTIKLSCPGAGSTTATFDAEGELIDGSNELSGVLAGTLCKVTETDSAGADDVSYDPGRFVMVKKNRTVTATVTNTFDPKGDVEVVKALAGDRDPDPGTEFVIDLDCGDAGSTTATFDAEGELVDGSNELTDLLAGTECTVTETNDGGADDVSYDPGQNVTVGQDEVVTVTVTNTFWIPRGDLEVNKVVAGEGAPEPGAEFTVAVECEGWSEPEEVVFDASGEVVSGSNVFTDLEAGIECTVSETDSAGADDVSYDPGQTVTIVEDTTVDVTVTNTFDPKGDVEVVKALAGDRDPDPGTEFVIDLDCGDAGSTTATFDAEGELVDGSNELTDLLAGTECTVTETNDGDADEVSYDPGQNVTVGQDEVVTVTVTNTFWIPRGDLEVNKVVAGEGAPEPGAEFTVAVECEGWSEPEEVVFDASGEVVSGSNVFTDLEAGIECTVSETDSAGADDVSYDPGQTVTIVEDTTVDVTVTNTFDPKGDVEVVKALAGDRDPDPGTEFVIDLDCGDAGSTTATFDAEGELVDGSNELTDLLAGTECTVTETNDGDADDVSYDPGQTVTVAQDEVVTVTVTNTFDPKGSIEVLKAVEGQGSPEAGTEFVVELDCEGVEGVTATFDASGELIDGSNRLEDLDEGTECTIVETNDGDADAVTYDPGQTVAIEGDTESSVTVTNFFDPEEDPNGTQGGGVLGQSLEEAGTPEGEVLASALEDEPEGGVLSSALGGDLPRTGIFIGLLLAIAAALLMMGTAITRAARRR